MPLDIPLVPVNSDAKTFAAQSLMQAINNMHLAQAGGGGGTTQSKAQSDAEKKEDEAAKKAAARSVLDEKLPGQDQPPASTTPPMSAPSGSGLSGLQQTEQGITGIVGTTDIHGNPIPVKPYEAPDASISVLPAY